MKLFGLELRRVRQQKEAPFESTLQRLVAAQDGFYGSSDFWGTAWGSWVTPENCMQSPTVHAVVTAVARRIAVSPVEVFRQMTVTTDTGDAAEPTTERVRRNLVPEHT